MFLANYTDGLSDAPLPEMVELLQEERQDRLLPGRAPAADLPSRRVRRGRQVQRMRASADSDIWINAGYFVFRNRIFDYIKEGEELVDRAVPAPDRGRRADRLPA